MATTDFISTQLFKHISNVVIYLLYSYKSLVSFALASLQTKVSVGVFLAPVLLFTLPLQMALSFYLSF